MTTAILIINLGKRPSMGFIVIEDTLTKETLKFLDSEEGFEDLCHLWVKRACRHAEWEGELI